VEPKAVECSVPEIGQLVGAVGLNMLECSQKGVNARCGRVEKIVGTLSNGFLECQIAT
jgi:hypothetical protein